MRTRFRAVIGLLVAAVLVVTGLTAAPEAGAQDETVSGSFDLLTFNVAGLPEGLSGSNPSVNMPLIAPLLDAYDVVLTQEDFANPDPPIAGTRVYHDVLVAGTNFPYLSAPQVPPMGSNPQHPHALLGDGLNFFSRFPLGPVDRTTWEECFGVVDHASDCLATKGFALTTIELGPGATVDVYDLHADAGSAVEDQAARESNFLQLAAFIRAHSQGHAVILGGDTNLHTDRPEASRLWQGFLDDAGLSDVCATVDCGVDTDVIDKVAFRGVAGVDLTPVSHVFERARFTRSDGQPLSDHDPLHVRFDYTAVVTPTTTTSTTVVPAPPAPPAVAVNRPPSFTG